MNDQNSRPGVMSERTTCRVPFFSVCIPQYNRTSFLLVLLESLRAQTWQDFEICISDGGSTDGRYREIQAWLQGAGVEYRLWRSEATLPYDQNLRSCIGLARGRYCFLCGNDDSLAGSGALATLGRIQAAWDSPEVAIANYLELSTGRLMRRMPRTQVLGAGPSTAARHFRSFSFVSGVVLTREPAQRWATARWDGSEMYQMYLGCRTIARGGRLLGVDEVLVHKDTVIANEEVDSYARGARVAGGAKLEITLPLSRFGAVAWDAIGPSVAPSERQRMIGRVLGQVLVFTYPPWLLEYRRVRSWRFALGVALGMRPRRILESCAVNWFTRFWITALHLVTSWLGLCTPRGLFERLRPWCYSLAKGHYAGRRARP
jgi:glycosyltransferase involved in cell wall biosynthesis